MVNRDSVAREDLTSATLNSFFPSSYIDARRRLADVCKATGLQPRAYINPEVGREGEQLATDVIYVGDQNADRVVVLVSATHGVEGFPGTAAQVDWLATKGLESLPPNTGVLIVHAINPYGYSWERRGTEGNIDLNRNGLDFSAPLLQNEEFKELTWAFSPKEIAGEPYARARAALNAFQEKVGLLEFRRVRSMGQHCAPDAIHYGGQQATWSHKTILEICNDFRLGERTRVGIVDFHTGLGPFGYGEPICGCLVHEPGRDWARAWYGESLTEPLLGTSTSAVIPGLSQYIWKRGIGADRFAFIALEFGTYPPAEMEAAMEAENWLYAYGDPKESRDAGAIRSRFRRAFYPETIDWQEMVLWRCRQVIRQTLTGISRS